MTPRQVSIPAESRDLLAKAAEKLKNVTVEPSRVMSGAIVGLRHTPLDSVGYITISTVRKGRPAEVAIKLPYTLYMEALAWHADRRVLLVEGEVEGGRGNRLHIDEPIRCEPIDDLFTGSQRRRGLIVPQRHELLYEFNAAAPAELSPDENLRHYDDEAAPEDS